MQHPIDKKNTNLAMLILTLAFFITVFIIYESRNYIFVIVVLFILAFSNTMLVKHKMILAAIFIVIGISIMYTVRYFVDKSLVFYEEDDSFRFILSFVIAAGILLVPFFFVYIHFIHLVNTAINEKKYYHIIKGYPYLICKEHHTRTEDYSILGYKGVKCRTGKKCLKKQNIEIAVQLIGLVGIIKNGTIKGKDYYVTLWDHRVRKIRYGDYDIIEIRENESIKDYNFIIIKIINFFYNEINRYKPLNEVIVKIIGKPDISENTKRIMEKHFLKIEYIT